MLDIGTKPARSTEAGCPSHVRIGERVTVLDSIRHAGINLAVWRRRVPDLVASWLDEPATPSFLARRGDLDITLPTMCVTACVATHLAIDGMSPRSKSLAAFAEEVGALAAIASRTSKTESVRVRLERVTEQTCPCFHVDRVSFRLLCTYRGAGTEWLPDAGVADASISAKMPSIDAIRHMEAGDVAIMRGATDDPQQDYSPLRHRSPPIAAPSDWRLFLSIDPA